MPLNYAKQERFTNACRIADISSIKKYIWQGVDVNYSSEKPPVVEAIKFGSLEAVKILVESGADVYCYITDPTPLHYAAHTGNKEIFLYLIEHGAYIPDKQSLFQEACLSGSIELVDHLLKDNVEINELCLKYACKSENLNLIKRLIELKPSVYQKNLLPEAIKASHPEMVKFFIEQGEDISQTTDDGTPIEIASHLKFEDISARSYIMESPRNDELFKLLKQAAKASDDETLAMYKEETLLEFIMQFSRDMENIKNMLISLGAKAPESKPPISLREVEIDFFKIAELLRNGADINNNGERHNNIMHKAFQSKNINIVKLLMKYGMNINCIHYTEKTKNGNYHSYGTGCFEHDKKAIRFYLENGGNVHDIYQWESNLISEIISDNDIENLRLVMGKYPDVNRAWDTEGNTMMHYAAKCYYTKPIIGALLKLGADVNSRNNKGETPIMNVHDTEIINYLVAAGADINAEDNEGNTILHQNSEDGDNHHALRWLINNGADVNHQNHLGDTPIHSLLKTGRSTVCNAEFYIFDRGADLNIKNNEGKSVMDMFIEADHPYLWHVIGK